MADTKALAVERIREAMDHVQEAQRQLHLAEVLLSSVVGALPRQRALGNLYDRVRAEWYRLEKKTSQRVDLDGPSKAALLRQQAGGGHE